MTDEKKTDFIKVKKLLVVQRILSRTAHRMGEKYLKIIYMIKNLYIEYIKILYNSIIKDNFKIGT